MNSRTGLSALNLFNIKGIPVRVHWSFALLLLWVAASESKANGNPAEEVLYVVAIFACVLLHELSHALVARRFGISTKSIVLYPFGGVASITSDPLPKAELFIALAGPLVNVIIAILLYPFATLPDLQGNVELRLDFVTSLMLSNVALAVFNMLPALPMDGGRVLRAALALMKVRSATVIAARVSQVLSILLGVYAIYSENILLVLVAMVVFSSAMQEYVRSKARSAAKGQNVRDVMTDLSQLQTFTHGTTVSAALRVAVRSFQPIFPVIHSGRVLGVVDRDQLLQAGALDEEEQYVAGIMQREFLSTSPDEPLSALVERLQAGEDGNFLVMRGDELVGILARERLFEFLLVEGLRKRQESEKPAGE